MKRHAKHGEGRSGKSTSGAGSVTWKSVPLNLFFTRYGDFYLMPNINDLYLPAMYWGGFAKV